MARGMVFPGAGAKALQRAEADQHVDIGSHSAANAPKREDGHAGIDRYSSDRQYRSADARGTARHTTCQPASGRHADDAYSRRVYAGLSRDNIGSRFQRLDRSCDRGGLRHRAELPRRTFQIVISDISENKEPLPIWRCPFL